MGLPMIQTKKGTTVGFEHCSTVSQDSWDSSPLSKSISTGGTALCGTVVWLISGANELMIAVVSCWGLLPYDAHFTARLAEFLLEQWGEAWANEGYVGCNSVKPDHSGLWTVLGRLGWTRFDRQQFDETTRNGRHQHNIKHLKQDQSGHFFFICWYLPNLSLLQGPIRRPSDPRRRCTWVLGAERWRSDGSVVDFAVLGGPQGPTIPRPRNV